MTLTQLEYILALDKYRHYVSASRHCQVTQPALTSQVKKLEDELGIIIFDRTRKPLAPTDLGEKVIAQAKRVISEAATMRALVQGKLGTSGELVLGVLPTVGPYLLPLIVDELAAKHPFLKLDVKAHEARRLVIGLRTGEFNAVLMSTPMPLADFNIKPMYYEHFIAYVPKRHPVAAKRSVPLETLRKSAFFRPNEDSCFHNQISELLKIESAEEPPNGSSLRYQQALLGVVQPLLDQLNCLTVLPELAQLALPDDVKSSVRPIRGAEGVRQISLVTSQTHEKQELTKALAETIRKVLPKRMQDSPKVRVLDPAIHV